MKAREEIERVNSYVSANWEHETDPQMAGALDVNVWQVMRARKKLGFKRTQKMINGMDFVTRNSKSYQYRKEYKKARSEYGY